MANSTGHTKLGWECVTPHSRAPCSSGSVPLSDRCDRNFVQQVVRKRTLYFCESLEHSSKSQGRLRPYNLSTPNLCVQPLHFLISTRAMTCTSTTGIGRIPGHLLACQIIWVFLTVTSITLQCCMLTPHRGVAPVDYLFVRLIFC